MGERAQASRVRDGFGEGKESPLATTLPLASATTDGARPTEKHGNKNLAISAYSGEAGQQFQGKLDAHSRASWTVGA